MRDINLIVVHCTATKPSQDIGVEEVRKWHMDKGWSDVGYHFIINRRGDIENGRPLEKSGAHAKGFNSNSIGIALVGGIDDEGKPDANFTNEQYTTLKYYLGVLKTEYPQATILGHRDLPDVAKACPCFNVKEFIK